MNTQIPAKAKILNASHLKIIAVITMLIDHSTKALLYNCVMKKGVTPKFMSSIFRINDIYRFLRGVGRLAFPIFCFFLVEGFVHTRSRAKYLMRLLIFGIISEIPFDLGLYENIWYPRHQNVMFELAAGILMLWIWESLLQSKRLGSGLILILQAVSAAALMYTAQKLHLDYGFKGLALILALYILRPERISQCISGALIVSIWEWPAVFSFPLLCLYNGRRGRQLKYFFYAFYPGHLALLALLSGILKNRL